MLLCRLDYDTERLRHMEEEMASRANSILDIAQSKDKVWEFFLLLYKFYRISDYLLIQRNKKVQLQPKPFYFSELLNSLTMTMTVRLYTCTTDCTLVHLTSTQLTAHPKPAQMYIYLCTTWRMYTCVANCTPDTCTADTTPVYLNNWLYPCTPHTCTADSTPVYMPTCALPTCTPAQVTVHLCAWHLQACTADCETVHLYHWLYTFTPLQYKADFTPVHLHSWLCTLT